jgi:TRAP-type C4-dicarboxylate transport system permease small subunit
VKTILTRPIEFACGVLMVSVTGVVFLQVISRYVFHHPFDWPEELARYLFVWVALLGAALALSRGAHFSIDALVKRCPLKTQACIALTAHGGLSIFLLLVVVSGLQLALKVHEQPSAAMEISMTFPYLSIPISFTFMFMFTLVDLYRLVKKGGLTS